MTRPIPELNTPLNELVDEFFESTQQTRGVVHGKFFYQNIPVGEIMSAKPTGIVNKTRNMGPKSFEPIQEFLEEKYGVQMGEVMYDQKTDTYVRKD